MKRLFAIVLGCAAAAACKEGDVAEPTATRVAKLCASADAPPLTRANQRVRRLADVELDAVLSDLAGEPVVVSSSLIPDPRADGYDNDATALVVSGPKLESYLDAIEPLLDKIVAHAPCATRDCLARAIAPRAFGRPITDEEVAKLGSVFDAGGARLVVEAILLSPSTLYRSEIGAADGQLDDFEIASQLSFFLTGSRPDDALYAAATRGELHDPKVVRAHAERLLDTPRARQQMRRFAIGWLELGRLAGARRGIEYPKFTPEAHAAMTEELGRFVEHTLFDGDGTFEALLTSDVTYPDPALAPIYGNDALDAPAGDVAVRVDASKRKGILSLPAFLTGHATRDGTNPVDRGLFVRTRLLCAQIGPPPRAALAMPVDVLSDKTTTTRQKFEKHGTDPVCATCHSLLDPVGFGFEKFDAIGAFRDTENGQPVDDTGVLTDTDVAGPFAGPAQLADKLATSVDAKVCFVSQLARFADGRAEDDVCRFQELTTSFSESGGRIRDLLLAWVTRRDFFRRKVSP